LPTADELRRIPIEKPPGPVTAEPGLATHPPEQLALENQKPEEQKPEQKAPSESEPGPTPAA
jgi:hypothetical protein